MGQQRAAIGRSSENPTGVPDSGKKSSHLLSMREPRERSLSQLLSLEVSPPLQSVL
ncbi:hypothetical protein [Calothrix sp. NIES-2098]|uniref:hypothetical protein n=1 Tax=Calothrix sp. NIES-2098 TaxID=1954171 RepID=UPI0030DBBDFC